MKSKTKTILAILNVLAWLAFIGLVIQAGAFIVSYILSFHNPEATKHFNNNVNLYELRQYSFVHYTVMVVLLVLVPSIEAYTAYLVTTVLSKIKLQNPFTTEISKLLETISYYILATWVLVVIYNSYLSWLLKKIQGLHIDKMPGDFIFLAGVIFVFAQIFKKGVELQTENELTV